jgi:LysM repeat protein
MKITRQLLRQIIREELNRPPSLMSLIREEEESTYTIAKGDSLSGISQRFYGSEEQDVYDALAQANNLPDSNAIEAGASLTLPNVLPVGDDHMPVGDTGSQSLATGQSALSQSAQAMKTGDADLSGMSDEEREAWMAKSQQATSQATLSR